MRSYSLPGLAALLFGVVLLSGCSGTTNGSPDDVPGTDLQDTLDQAGEPELDAADLEASETVSPPTKPKVVIQSHKTGDVIEGRPRVKVEATHPCGIASVSVKLSWPSSSSAKSADGAPLGSILWKECPNTDLSKTQFECRMDDTSTFPEGAHDKDDHDISGDKVPDGPVTLVVVATSACDEGPTAGLAGVGVVLDNHGPTIHLISPTGDEKDCRTDELRIELWIEDQVSGLADAEINVSVDDERVATPDPKDATKQNPFVILHHLEGITDGAVTVVVTATDKNGNESEVQVEVCVALAPAYRIVQKVGPKDENNEFLSNAIRWIDFGVFEFDGDDEAVVLLATSGGVYASKLTPQGLPKNFEQLTNRQAEFVRAVPSRAADKDYPFALVVVEQLPSGDAGLVVYEDPYSVDGHPAAVVAEGAEVVEDAEVVDAVADGADAVEPEPIVYDFGLVVETNVIKGSLIAVWMGDLVGADAADGGAPDVVIGTQDSTTGLQIYQGDDGLERWFSEGPVDEVAGVDLTATLAVADMDGDGLKDITIGRQAGGEFKGFKQTRQYDEGRFAWTQNYIPSCNAPSGTLGVADMNGLAVADLLDGDGVAVPEIVAVSATLSTVSVFRREMIGLPMAHRYTCLPTAFAIQGGTFAPDLLLGAEPRQVLVTDVNGDDLQDLVVVNQGSGNVAVLPSYVNGEAFQVDESKVVYYNVGPDPYRAWLFDQDQDGCNDLLVAHEGVGTYSWLRNPGCDGNLVAAVDSPCPPDPAKAGARLTPLELGVDDVDLKPDAFDDVVLLTQTIGVEEAAGDNQTQTVKHYPLWLYASRTTGGDGVESTARQVGLLPAEFSTGVNDFALGNVAKSSHPDVLVAFATPSEPPTEETDETPTTDEPVSRYAIAAMYWSSQGEGSFAPLIAAATGAGTVAFNPDPVAIALGRVSNQTPANMVDFVTVHAEKGAPSSEDYRPPRVVSYQVNSSGTGAPFIERDKKEGAVDGVGPGPVDAVLGPVTAFDNPLNDVLVVNRQNQDVSLFQGTDQGLFGDAIPAFGLGADPLAINLVHWNDDCFLDIAILTADNLVIAYWNVDAGAFEPAFFYGLDEATSLGSKADAVKGAVELLVSDTNHDCRDDLVVLNKNRSQVYVFTSSGAKAPGEARPIPPVAFPTGSGPIHLAKGNLNGDQCEDLAVLNGRGQSVTVLISGNCVTCTPPVDCSDNP